MKLVKAVALRCDLSEKEIIVGERVLIAVGTRSLNGTIAYVWEDGSILRVGIQAGGRHFSNLVVGEDRVALRTLGTLLVS